MNYREVSRKEFYTKLDLSKAKEVYCDSITAISLQDNKIFKCVQFSNHYCEVSIDCMEVIEGTEDNLFYIGV